MTWNDVMGTMDGEVYDLLFPAQKVAHEAYSNWTGSGRTRSYSTTA